jgi:hypothetical protein
MAATTSEEVRSAGQCTDHTVVEDERRDESDSSDNGGDEGSGDSRGSHKAVTSRVGCCIRRCDRAADGEGEDRTDTRKRQMDGDVDRNAVQPSEVSTRAAEEEARRRAAAAAAAAGSRRRGRGIKQCGRVVLLCRSGCRMSVGDCVLCVSYAGYAI